MRAPPSTPSWETFLIMPRQPKYSPEWWTMAAANPVATMAIYRPIRAPGTDQVDGLGTDEPGTDEPIDEPGTDEPIDEPGTDEPADGPGTDGPGTDEPTDGPGTASSQHRTI
ncbi:hypothetical protein ST47_g10165 [Ascochyta rabiei]|uniref:Uncharacterized protein n=1 Tax=Didymella rabiei TaxID=5454 RepID=A0A162W5H9_DIDRA|nr:hypothetical protein ST47_g10165 [Ascochyta rabiei]